MCCEAPLRLCVDIQQSRTNLSRKDPDYKRILDRLDISPQLVENTEAKQIKPGLF